MTMGRISSASVWLWPQLRQNVPLLYYLQHVGSQLALAVFFGRTLLGPGEALITRIARTPRLPCYGRAGFGQ